MGKLAGALLGVLFTTVVIIPSEASNTPCSGRKGGISHCQGNTFVCNDGSVSASKKTCTAFMGDGSSGALGVIGGNAEMAPAGDTHDCSCRSGQYCIGPRGGHYCTTDSGFKSYLRN